MRFRNFEWDNINTVHISEHGVTPEEAEEACFRNPRIFKTRELRYYVLGQTQTGRYLAVIVQPKPRGVVRVITSRDMTTAERQRFLRK